MSVAEFAQVLRKEFGLTPTEPVEIGYVSAVDRIMFVGALDRIMRINRFFVDGKRVDKVNAIDAVMHETHEEGAYLTWILGQRGDKTEDVILFALEELFRG